MICCYQPGLKEVLYILQIMSCIYVQLQTLWHRLYTWTDEIKEPNWLWPLTRGRPVVSSGRTPSKDKTVTVHTGHEPLMGLDAKTNWLTVNRKVTLTLADNLPSSTAQVTSTFPYVFLAWYFTLHFGHSAWYMTLGGPRRLTKYETYKWTNSVVSTFNKIQADIESGCLSLSFSYVLILCLFNDDYKANKWWTVGA
jgi:hypothetical protein